MIFTNEKQKRIDELYSRLQDLKEGKRILEGAMHQSFYDRDIYNRLYIKLLKLNAQIKDVKKELTKEKKEYEKSRQSV